MSQFVKSLKNAGFNNIRKKETNLGLSLILGGCGVSLEELTRLFSAFANDGLLYNFKYLTDKNSINPVRVLSPASAYIITDILSKVERPDLPVKFESNYHVPKISWKTGTSYGRRDAWSIGYWSLGRKFFRRRRP